METNAAAYPGCRGKLQETGERSEQYFVPTADIAEGAHSYILVLDMPGVTQDQLEVNYEKNTLTVTGRVSPTRFDTHTLSLQGYREGNYRRAFTVSDDIDVTNAKATLKDGVLTLELPKSARIKPRKIEVRVSS